VFGELFVSLTNDIIEMVSTGIIGFISLLFIQYGALEFDRIKREIRREKEKISDEESEFKNELFEMKKHWKIIMVGSTIGLFIIIGRVLFYFFTGNFPTIIGDEIVEIATSALMLSGFLWFIHIGIVEYGDIKHSSNQQKIASDEEI
jgi:hypothetical protein